MKKLAVVLGVAAVATFTGCKDPDYVGRNGRSPQNEAKSIDTTPAPEPIVTPVEQPVEPVKTCKCPPGTKHTAPCKCGASDCTCVVEKPLPPPEPEYTIYVVQNGDYLAKISKKYNVTISSIKRINGLKSDSIRVGQKLKLPGKIEIGAQPEPAKTATKAPAKAGKTVKKGSGPYTGATKEYVVKNGDTLGSVAYGNGINIRQLKQLNGLTSDSLRVGQKLKIPAEKVAKVEKTQAASTGKPAKATIAVVVDNKEAAKPETKTPPVQAEPVVNPPIEDTSANVIPPNVPDAPASDKAPIAAETTRATTDYIVQEGETDVAGVAISVGTTPSVLFELNGFNESTVLKPGMVIKVPAE